ncbi:MAG: hypothetical protein HY329_08275, partial [Chloroflexi bacterium]|nr:hypothetical protein [Chloroflexota bacterium]
MAEHDQEEVLSQSTLRGAQIPRPSRWRQPSRPLPLPIPSLLAAVLILTMFMLAGHLVAAPDASAPSGSVARELNPSLAYPASAPTPRFVRSLDTMKESRDLQSGNQLTDEQIKH